MVYVCMCILNTRHVARLSLWNNRLLFDKGRTIYSLVWLEIEKLPTMNITFPGYDTLAPAPFSLQPID